MILHICGTVYLPVLRIRIPSILASRIRPYKKPAKNHRKNINQKKKSYKKVFYFSNLGRIWSRIRFGFYPKRIRGSGAVSKLINTLISLSLASITLSMKIQKYLSSQNKLVFNDFYLSVLLFRSK